MPYFAVRLIVNPAGSIVEKQVILADTFDELVNNEAFDISQQYYYYSKNPIDTSENSINQLVSSVIKQNYFKEKIKAEENTLSFIIEGSESQYEFDRKVVNQRALSQIPKSPAMPAEENVMPVKEKKKPIVANKLSLYRKVLSGLNMISHPGNWVFAILMILTVGSILSVFAISMPLILGPITVFLTFIAAFSLLKLAFDYHKRLKNIQNQLAPQVKTKLERNWYKTSFQGGYTHKLPLAKIALVELVKWFKHHPFQVAAVAIALALFVTTLVLTIGFFTGGIGIAAMAAVGGSVVLTGGGAFAFMAPVFSAIASSIALSPIATPFALAVMSAVALVLAPLNLGNTAKRFMAWVSAKLDKNNLEEDESNALKDEKATIEKKQVDALYITPTFDEFFTAAITYLKEVPPHSEELKSLLKNKA